MTLRQDDVHKLATLAKIALSQSEEETIAADLSGRLLQMQALVESDLSNVEPTRNLFAHFNAFRQDVCVPSMDREALLACAPERDERCVIVPQIMD